MREIGVLMITFGPLDAAVTHEDPSAVLSLLLFFSLGLLLFVGSIWLEWRRTNVH